MGLKSLLLLTVLVGWNQAADTPVQAPTIGVEARPEKTEVTLAEPFEVTYVIHLAPHTDLDLGSWKPQTTQWSDFILWDFKIKNREADPRLQGSQKIEILVSLMPFKLGKTE